MAPPRPLMLPKIGRGEDRKVDMREIFNAILYLQHTGCQWDYLPHDFGSLDASLSHFGGERRELPAVLTVFPAAERIAINVSGQITGLF